MGARGLDTRETARMGYHTFDPDRADILEEPDRYMHLSAEELVGALGPSHRDLVLDLGSGTGFYTDDLAPHVGRILAVDVQPAMHRYYRAKGLPSNVDLLTAEIGALPIASQAIDAAISTMTYHEFAGAAATAEIARILRPNGRLVIVDWSADGPGDSGPSLAERYALETVVSELEQGGFTVELATNRIETLLVVATPSD